MKVRDLIKELSKFDQELEVDMMEQGEKFPYPVWCVETFTHFIADSNRKEKVVMIVGLDE